MWCGLLALRRVGGWLIDAGISAIDTMGDRTLCRVLTRKVAAEFFGKNLVANLELVCYANYLRAISTVVAHFLHTEGVGGSNPSLPIKNFNHLGDYRNGGSFMTQIILNSEQEKLLQQQLETGKYTTPDQVITDALKALSEKQHLNQPRQVVTIISGKPAQELLAEKIKISRELKKSYQPDPHKQALAEDFSNLCEETQALHADHSLTDEEIAEEIAAYRRGE